MLEGIARGGHPGSRQPRRDDPALRGAPDLERLGHRPEIRNDAGGHRRGDRQRGASRLDVQRLQGCGGRGGRDRAEHRRRMEALAVIAVPIACDQIGPDLVTRNIGRDHALAVGAGTFAHGEDDRDEDRARVTVESDVVEVERMGGGAVDQRRDVGPGARLAPEDRRLAAGGRRLLRCDDSRDRLVEAEDHDADAIDDSARDDRRGLGGQMRVSEAADEGGRLGGEIGHWAGMSRWHDWLG